MNKSLAKHRFRKLLKRENGAILLEAILSVVIVAISLTTIVQSYLMSFRGHVQGADFTRALLLMENQMTEMFFEQGNKIPGGGSGEKTFDPPLEQFSALWKAEPAPAQRPFLNLLRMSVLWREGSKDKKIAFETFMIEPQNE